MIELTEQQQKALDTSPAPRFVDPRNHKTYVLVGADTYERLEAILAEDVGLDMKQVAVLVDVAMREEDAGDETLEFYQREYGRKT